MRLLLLSELRPVRPPVGHSDPEARAGNRTRLIPPLQEEVGLLRPGNDVHRRDGQEPFHLGRHGSSRPVKHTNVTSCPSSSHQTAITWGMMLARLAFMRRAYSVRVGVFATRSITPMRSLRMGPPREGDEVCQTMEWEEGSEDPPKHGLVSAGPHHWVLPPPGRVRSNGGERGASRAKGAMQTSARELGPKEPARHARIDGLRSASLSRTIRWCL